MGVTTSFFIASWAELEAAAPGWVRTTYGPYQEVEVMCPFTRQPRRTMTSDLLTEIPAEAPPHEIHGLVPDARAYAWKLVGHELGDLMKIILRASDEEAKRLGHLALIGPEDQENWVSEIPAPFVEALAALSPERIPAVASAWKDEIEWEDPTALLEQLVEVASEAVAAKKQMFTFVCL